MTNCKNCGKEFKKTTYNRIYCSRDCILEYRRKQNLQNLKTKVCLWCRQEYTTKFPRQRFCDYPCSVEFRRMQQQIYQVFPFCDTSGEIKRLEELGKNYTFPEVISQ